MAIFRRIFRRPNLNSNMDVTSSKSGRGIFVVLGLAVILVLAAGAYMYGQQKNDKAKTADNKPTTEQSNGAESPQPSNSTPAPQPSTTNESQDDQAQAPTPVPEQPNTTSVPNTGPEDYYPIAVSLIVLAVWYYQRARKESSQAELFRAN